MDGTVFERIRSDKEPLYLQVKTKIQELISKGEDLVGRTLPPENVIASQLGVSRTTVREALRMLEEEGIVARKQGLGTFILQGGSFIESGLEELRSITEIIRKLGMKAGTEGIRVGEQPAGSEVARKLQVAEGEEVITIERVRTADGERVVYSYDVIPRRFLSGRDITLEIPKLEAGLFTFLESECRLKITHAVSYISATTADDNIVSRLHARPGEPLLVLDQVHFGMNRQPVLYSKDYFRTEKFTFYVIRRRR
ncbi:MAG TPA: GntR family transcriptional regulator [Firmicutes bacterium]|nr:GntR family transcriptional regulator [Bacillota bacterium]